MAHFIIVRVQNNLPSHTGVRIDGHGAFQIDCAVRNRLFYHAQHVITQFLTVFYTQSLKLLGLENGGIVCMEGKGIHGHEGKGGSVNALKAEQGAGAAVKGKQKKFMLVLKAEQTAGEREQLTRLIVDFTEVLGLELHKYASCLLIPQASTSIGL